MRAEGTFEVTLNPVADGELGGRLGRFELAKVWDGDLVGSGDGVMLSGGDPGAGAAGYVAVEVVDGRLGEREGGFALQQFGTMEAGEQVLYYEVVPGSGRDGLAGITGTVHLTVDEDGTHRYVLDYTLT
jgi:Protein of unknown function (DUF3224)